jgi:transcriptional regulator with XRE-family HTH domain
MNEQPSKKTPYNRLGSRLRFIREKNNQTIDQVSGAVEVDTETMIKFEDGVNLPDQDILLLLISHFNLNNDEAKKIWQMAGYDSFTDTFNLDHTPSNIPVPTIVILPFDNKIIYSDQVQITANNYGLVLNFMQASTQKNNTPQFISRIGLSKEHAADIVKMLSEALKNNLLESDKKIDNNSDKK